jgi:thiol-disulfide isomerase/thioredoxin
MWTKKALNKVVLMLLAVLLLAAAVLKGHELLTAPVADMDNAVTVKSPALSLNESKNTTSQYEVLEPETWIGKELPILDHIDIGKQLKTGNWLIMLYHYDCPNCIATIPKIEQMAKELQGNEDVLKFALIEIPPYGFAGTSPVNSNIVCVTGKLNTSKEWFVTTPAIILVSKSNVTIVLSEITLQLDQLLDKFK